MKSCLECSATTEGRAKRCLACKKRIHARKVAEFRARTGRIKKPGSGSGGNQTGASNHQYKHGGYTHETQRQTIKISRQNCERCNVSLIDADHHEWCIHHKDHNARNNPADGSNWELLCKRCHQIEHECWTAFSKVQRLSGNGVGERTVPEAHNSTPTVDDDIV